MLKLFDYILIAVLIIFAISFNYVFLQIYGGGSSDEVVVTVEGQVYGKYSLKNDGIYNVSIDNDGIVNNQFEIKNGIVNMTDANCPDKYCIHSKGIEYNSEAIVCLPNKVVLQINSESPEKDSGIDSIVQ